MLKPLLINTRDIIGGAAIAAYRIHCGLQNLGIESTMLVDIKRSSDPSVIKLSKGLSNQIRSRIDHFPLRFMAEKTRSISWVKSGVIRKIRELNPDVIHFHWINNGFISIEQLSSIKFPMVWTLHDMWAFSDSRHYVPDSESPSYRANNWLDRWVWSRKKETYQKVKNLHIVAPSQWLAECIRKSDLLGDRPVHVIANGIDTEVYRPMEKLPLRMQYGIAKDAVLILFSGYSAVSDKRKGFQHLVRALEIMKDRLPSEVSIGIVGSDGPTVLDTMGVSVHYFGNINDQLKMRDIYAMADVFVLPSLQDNLPNTAIEALACGCPMVAFHVGGIPDIVDHLNNGYLAKWADPKDLAQGILWYLNAGNKKELSEAARKKILKDFDLKAQSGKYIDLYSKIIAEA